MTNTRSVEPSVADAINSQLKSYRLDYKLEQESLNSEIDSALQEYFTKSGGKGGNRPDAKLLLQDGGLNFYPVLIEYKGYEDKLEKLDADGNVENRTAKNEPNFKNIKDYAVNGAVHYANALLHHTSYTDIIAIGVAGYKDSKDKLQTKIGVYYVSKSNLGVGRKVGDFTDLSFLEKTHFSDFTDKLKNLNLTPDELEKIKQKREKEIDASLVKLNNDIYSNEKGLGENDRVYLVAASIIATLGIPGKVAPLEKSELKSSSEKGSTDGEILMRKIEAFLNEKKLPVEKKDLIIRTLSNTILTDNINKISNGETQLKRVFSKIVDDLGIYYKIGLTTDFTGKLFNEMYSWLGFTQDKLNDVVLTPSYVATLLAKLARVNKDSYVWDFATGSAGLLVAAMNEMLKDAKNNISSPDELTKKEAHIKAYQLLGLELLSSVYMLAVLNMIMMGDGSSNILNKDSLTDFEGVYGFGKDDEPFPANAFVLNPPYSAEGNGMIFVETALNMMKGGYAAIIIQNSAGSGKAKEINKRILAKNTLIASIKMPIDLFVGKSSVQTNVYVFKVGEKHEKDEIVKFIDFSNDGYTRSNRKKASNNLRDTDRAKERYEELVNLVRFGASKLEIFTQNEYYEATIDPSNGADWNKSRPVDTMPTLTDFKKSVSDYLSWEVSQILKKDSPSRSSIVSQRIADLEREFKVSGGRFEEFRIGDIFDIQTPKRKFDANKIQFGGQYPYVARGDKNNGIRGYINENTQYLNDENTISFGQDTATMFFQKDKYFTGDKIKIFKPINFDLNIRLANYIIASMRRGFSNFAWGSSSFNVEILKDVKILLPALGGNINFSFMEKFIEELECERVEELDAYLAATGLKDYKLTEKEKDALAKFDEFSKWGGVASKFTTLETLFDNIKQGRRLKKEDQKDGLVPFVMAGVTNTGVINHISNPVVTFPKNSITVDIFGNTFYRNYDFGAGDDTGVYWNESKEYSQSVMLYFAASISKSLRGRFFYGKKLRSSQSLKFKINLPAVNDRIDYEFMENFIKAIEKLVIKDVVQWTDKKIEATKKVVAKI
ncbi:restriction endonuclease subunit S [Campylobacter showae]|uniref:restriction endonuclease subunit S n=2 Tax=Campylobacter showae TaxID=204 RepID=UPI0028D71AA4|nr:restriction endonuclease subunit S [Campylobacter showae]